MAELLGWGAGGIQQYKAEQAQDAALEMDRVSQGLAMAKAQREEASAEAEAQVGKVISDIAMGRNVPLDDPKYGVPGDPADALSAGAIAASESGQVETASKLFAQVARLRAEEGKARTEEIRQRNEMFELSIKQADFVDRVTSPVAPGDEEAFDAAFDNAPPGLFSEEQLAKLRDIVPTPEVLASIRNSALSGKDRAIIAAREDADSARAEAQRRTDQYRADRLQLSRDRAAQQKAADDAKAKAGGDKAFVASTTAERTAVETLVSGRILTKPLPTSDDIKADPSLASIVDNFDYAVTTIAGRTKEIAKEKGITFEQAASLAITESQANGDWEDVLEDPWFIPIIGEVGGGGKTGEKRFKPARRLVKGETPEEGETYIMPDGARAKFDGTNFIGE